MFFICRDLHELARNIKPLETEFKGSKTLVSSELVQNKCEADARKLSDDYEGSFFFFLSLSMQMLLL